MSLSLLLQQCFASLVHLIWMVLKMGIQWRYSCCFMGCCLLDLFNIARSVLVQFPSNFFSIHFVSIHVVHPYSSINTTTPKKKSHFILLETSDFHMIDTLSIAVNGFTRHILTSLLVDGMLLLRYMNLSTNFRGLLFTVEMTP